MSHVTTADCHVMSIPALGKAVVDLGGCLTRKPTFKWFNRHVGDYPLPAGYSVEDLGKCEYAISFPGADYEIGVVNRKDGKPGYTFMYDFYQQQKLMQIIGKDACNLKQAYTVRAFEEQAMMKFKTSCNIKKVGNKVVVQFSKF